MNWLSTVLRQWQSLKFQGRKFQDRKFQDREFQDLGHRKLLPHSILQFYFYRSRFRQGRLLQHICLGFCLNFCLAGLLLTTSPSDAQEPSTPSPSNAVTTETSPDTEAAPTPSRAAVTLNGETIFEVSGDPLRTAAERAKLMELQLQAAVETGQKSVVTVGNRDGTLALLLNGTLLTLITPDDLSPEATSPQEQAQAWRKELQTQLEQQPPPETITPPSSTPPPITASTQQSQRAPVEINSRRLFRIAEVGDGSAERRATEINNKLESLDPNGPEPTVEIREEAGSPTLWLQQAEREIYLLTVTQADATPSQPEQTAKNWAKSLQSGLRETQKEFKTGTQERLVSALGIFGIALMIQWGLVRLWVMVRRRLERLLSTPDSRDEEEEQSYQLLNFALRVLLWLCLLALWISALLYGANLFPVTRELSNTSRDYLLHTITAPVIPIGDGYSLASVVLLGGVLTAMLIASGALTDFLRSRFLAALGIGMGLQEAIAVVFKYSFITLGVIILLQLWGIDLSSLAILASALGVGIGFGFQDIAKNLGSGLVLVFERPIQVGDFVEVGGYTGTIEKLGARSTHIRTLDDLTVFVPNSRFLEEEVTNWSHRRSPSRIKIPLGVAYGSDLELVKTLLQTIAQEQRSILKSPKPQVFFMGFGDSSLDLMLLVWISRPQMHVRIRSELNFKIDAAFRQHHIEVPFPQRDLNFTYGELPISLNNGKTPSPDTMDQASTDPSQQDPSQQDPSQQAP